MIHSTVLLKMKHIETPLGSIVALANETAVHAVAFADFFSVERYIQANTHSTISMQKGHTAPLTLLEQEIQQYFSGTLQTFTVPLYLQGTPFQQRVWSSLQKIPYGTTVSYAFQAQVLGNPKAYRAVGSANGDNKCVLIVPCHRVINANNALGGYGAGLERKKWLLEHERQFKSK